MPGLNSYSAAATAHAIESIADEPVPYKISHLVARIFFRESTSAEGIWGWLKVVIQTGLDLPNREGILHEVGWERWQRQSQAGV